MGRMYVVKNVSMDIISRDKKDMKKRMLRAPAFENVQRAVAFEIM